MWSNSKRSKCCATCENWGGERDIQMSAAITDSPGTRGECYAGVHADALPGPCACGGRSCSRYSLWSELE